MAATAQSSEERSAFRAVCGVLQLLLADPEQWQERQEATDRFHDDWDCGACLEF
jgi:hypothetical protein